MPIEFNIETNPLDFIPEGEFFIVELGQLIIRSPIVVAGELKIEGHLITE